MRRQQKNNENNLLILCVVIQTFRPKKSKFVVLPRDLYSRQNLTFLNGLFIFGQYCLPYQYIEMSAAGLLNGQTAISTVTNMQQWSKTRPEKQFKKIRGCYFKMWHFYRMGLSVSGKEAVLYLYLWYCCFKTKIPFNPTSFLLIYNFLCDGRWESEKLNNFSKTKSTEIVFTGVC